MNVNAKRAAAASDRLYSLDVLRGMDMFLLSVVGVIVMQAHAVWGLPEGVVAQFSHPWGGFALWDLIMPLFIFMSGAAVPLASRRRLTAEGAPTAAYWRHLLSRFALLWLLGMVVQGRLLTLDVMQISPYNNTLQTIAVGSAVASLAYLLKPKWIRPCLAVALLAGYGIVMAFGGDYSREGNAAMLAELKILRALVPAGSLALDTHGYTWFLTTPVFAAFGLAGCCSTELLLAGGAKARKAAVLLATGALVWGTGWLLGLRIPSVKQFFSVSFSAQAAGWCMMAFAALYWVNDVLMLRRGMGLFLAFGRHSLAAYLGYTVLRPVYLAAAQIATGGLAQLFGAAVANFAAPTCAALILTAVILRLDASGRAGRN
ncbi:MAG: hypothetical protein ACI4RD_01155 [Kiritimatiellia bacterium]